MNSSSSSISFVITAIYTYTFGNAVFQILEFDDLNVNIQVRTGIGIPHIALALICMTMALRFFFGNNRFIDTLFSAPRLARIRLFHSSVVGAQSLILLLSSYFVRDPGQFLTWLAILFFSEIAWYSCCALFLPRDIQTADGKIDRSLAVNEAANLIVAVGALVAAIAAVRWPTASVYLVVVLFLMNTAIDLRVNLRGYMGL